MNIDSDCYHPGCELMMAHYGPHKATAGEFRQSLPETEEMRVLREARQALNAFEEYAALRGALQHMLDCAEDYKEDLEFNAHVHELAAAILEEHKSRGVR